jgi:thioredoxin-dependent peroxiredoxin
MTLAINDTAPDFEAETTEGKIRFHEWIGDKWAVMFSHPKDFTPVCTTELGYMAKIKPEFDKRGVKIIGLSVDPVDRHAGWAADIKETQGFAPNYPMIADVDFNVSKLYGMLPAAVSGDPTKRTAADNQTVRNVFVIGPDKKVKLILVYPMTTGRNFDEVVRVIDSLQMTAKHKVATPVNWKQGEDVIIAGSVSDEDAKKTYPQGWKAPKPYIRNRAAAESVRTSVVGARPTRPRSARQRPAGFLPAVEAALDVAGRGEARVLRRLHRHGRALAEGAVEQEPLAGRFAELMQHAARTDALLQRRVGHMQRARDGAVPLAF